MAQPPAGFPIPPELTLLIFRWAICIPGALTIFDSYFLAAYYETIRLSLWSEAHKTNLVLLQVCRQWNALTKELLFEHISMRRSGQLEELLDVLQKMSLQDRRRVKRMDIDGTDIRLSVPETLNTFMDVVSLVPDLTFLSIGYSFTTVGEGDRDIATHIAGRLPLLRRLQCLQATRSRPTSDSIYLRLQGLRWFTGMWTTGVDVIHSPPIENTSLTTLTLIFAIDADLPLQGLRLPALRRFTAEDIQETHSGLLQFLDTHGPQLTSLGLHYQCRDHGPLEMEILGRCTSLEELVRIEPRDCSINISAKTYPTIRRLGMCGVTSSSELKGGFINERGQLNRFPNLAVVRLIDITYASPPVGFSQELVESLLHPRGNFKYEDAYGLPIPLSSV